MTSDLQSATPGNPDDNGHRAQTDSFGSRLAAAIERKGWTLAQAAREISRHLPDGEVFNPVNLSHYMHGRSLPRSKYRQAIVQALDIEELPDVSEPKRARGVSPRGGPTGGSEIKVQDLGNGTARVQIDHVMPWPDALRVLQLLTHGQS